MDERKYSTKTIVLFYSELESIAELLIENDANVNIVGQFGYTALELAAYHGHFLKFILRIWRFSIDFIYFIGFERIVQTLIEKGAEINHVDDNGGTAIFRGYIKSLPINVYY